MTTKLPVVNRTTLIAFHFVSDLLLRLADVLPVTPDPFAVVAVGFDLRNIKLVRIKCGSNRVPGCSEIVINL